MNDPADGVPIGAPLDMFRKVLASLFRHLARGVLILASMHSSATSLHRVTLEESVCSADLIIVAGSILRVTERYMSVGLESSRPPRSMYLDKGYLQPARVLKGHYGATELGVLFPSKGQDDSFRKTIDPHIGLSLYFAGTGEVIWFLHQEIFDGGYIVLREFLPRPLSEVEAVVKIVGSGKCSADRFHKRAFYP